MGQPYPKRAECSGGGRVRGGGVPPNLGPAQGVEGGEAVGEGLPGAARPRQRPQHEVLQQQRGARRGAAVRQPHDGREQRRCAAAAGPAHGRRGEQLGGRGRAAESAGGRRTPAAPSRLGVGERNVAEKAPGRGPGRGPLWGKGLLSRVLRQHRKRKVGSLWPVSNPQSSVCIVYCVGGIPGPPRAG